MNVNKLQKLLYISGTVLIVLSYFFHPIPLQGLNIDLGHHLLSGKIILQNHSIPATNIFTYTAQHFVYIHTGWLSEVIFYVVFSLLHYNGLILLGMLLVLSTLFFLLINQESKRNYIGVCIMILLTMQLFIGRTEIKPELFSFALLSAYLYILYKQRYKTTKWIFIIPLLQVLWVNLHIYFIVGNLVTFCFFIDALRSNRYSFSNSKTKLFGLMTLVTLGANIINPYFIAGALYPLFIFNNYGMEVTENYTIFRAFITYIDLPMIYYICLLVFLWIGILVNPKNVKCIDFLLALLFSALSFLAVRNITLFAIGSIFPAASGLYYLYERFKDKLNITRRIYRNLIIIIIIILLICPGLFLSIKNSGFGFGTRDEAQDAVEIITKNKLAGPIYNNYNIGNYLEYKLYPKEKVFVNGSPEAFPKYFFPDVYYPSLSSYDAFKKLSDKYKFNSIFYDYTNQLADRDILLENVIKSSDWKLVYVNSRIVVFVKNNEKNKEFLKTHTISEDTLELSDRNLDSPETLGKLADLFRTFHWYKKMYEMDLKYLFFYPNDCLSLQEVIFYLHTRNDPMMNMYAARFQVKCMVK